MNKAKHQITLRAQPRIGATSAPGKLTPTPEGWESLECGTQVSLKSSKGACRLVPATAIPASRSTYLRMLMQPFPLVRKNMLLSLFQEISLTSNLNCSSAFERCVLASMKVTTSSLFPTAMVCPSGLQQMLMFSPGGTERQQVLLPLSNSQQPCIKQTGSFYS